MWINNRNFYCFLVILLLTTACSANQTTMNPAIKVDLIKSDQNRETHPTVDQKNIETLTSGQTEFAIDLFQQLRTKPGNLFFSPHSLHTAFAMAYAGAKGQTENQIAGVMHYELPQAVLHSTENAIDQSLNSSGGEEGEFILNVANSIWGQQDYPFNQAYLDTLAINYGAGLRLADYLSAEGRSKAANQINSWVKTETQDVIDQIVSQDDLTADTRLVLANAVYFKGAWDEAFIPKNTDSPFILLDGKQVNPDWMQREANTWFAELDDAQVVELTYKGDRIAMLILIPRAGVFNQFEETLDADKLQSIAKSLSKVNLSLVMPKFDFSTRYKLGKALEVMGMPLAFDPFHADFSGMLDPQVVLENLSISEVLHVADVMIDENGTEAAAATAITMRALSYMPMQNYQLTIDRPFIFLIRDRETGAVLFLGRVLDPTG